MTVAHIQHSIDRALKHDSGIDASVLEIAGFSTGVQRRLINNLVYELEGAYCEVGAYRGGTACAAVNNNPNITAYIWEDESQPFGEEGVLTSLQENLYAHQGSNPSVFLYEEDFFAGDLELAMPKPVEVFFYDGCHDREFQAAALPHVFDQLTDKFLFIVDDYDWPEVLRGTTEGFQKLKGSMDISKTWHLSDAQPDGPRWHNGMLLALCEKR